MLAGGPVILGGDDLTDHGRITGQTLIDGWLYIRKALENLAPGVTAINDGSVAVLGSSDSTATSRNAGAAYHFAVPQAAATTSLSGAIDFRDGATAINQFFAELTTGTVTPAIIVTAGTGAANNLDSSEGTALADNAAAIASFVNSGGGLLSHGFGPVAYGWLARLIPGVTFPSGANDCDRNTLSLTPLAQGLFPGLTNEDIRSGPCHGHFVNHGLPVLAQDHVAGMDPRDVIIGGNVVIPAELTLTQESATNVVGTTHTVTATVSEGNPLVPVVGALVMFDVIAGPNTGTSGTCSPNADCTSDANGQVSFTYLGDGGVGIDTIRATYTDSNNTTHTEELRKTWTLPANVDPVVVLDPLGIITENDEVTLTGSFTDTDLPDQHDVAVDWDDPNDVTVSMFALGATDGLTVGDMFPSTTTPDVLEITDVNLANGTVAFAIRRHQYLDDGAAPGNGTPEDTSTIMVAVSDSLATGQDSEDLLVQNEAPELVPGSVAISATQQNKATLGDVVMVSADFTDVGTLDQHTVIVDWGDGSSSNSDLMPGDFSSFVDSTGGVVGSFTANHTYGTSGVFTVMITVSDDDTGTVETTTEAFVNALPEVGLDPPGIIKENDEPTLTGMFVDPDLADQHDVTVDWDDPNNATDSMFALGATDGLTVGDTFPSTTTTAILEITGINLATGAVAFEIRRHQYQDDGAAPGNGTPEDTSTIVVTVSDADATGQDSEDLLVQNEAPELVPGSVVISATQNNKAEVGDLVTLSAEFTDVGTLDQHTAIVNWGDGSTSNSDLTPGDFSSFVDSTGGGVGSFTANHTYGTGGVFFVTIEVLDDDTGSVATTVRAWVNTLPQVVLDPPTTIKENDTATLIGRFIDPDRTDGHDVAVDWDDPNNATDSMFALGANNGLTVGDTFLSTTTTAVLEITGVDLLDGTVAFEIRRHQYLDDGAAAGNGTPEDTSTILVTVSDDGGPGQDNADLLVQNEAPKLVPGSVVISATQNNKAEIGDLVTLSAEFTDVGTLDQHTVIVDWGDGSTSNSDLTPGDFSSFVDSTGGGVGLFATSHTYGAGGIFTVTITVIDDDTGSVETTTQAWVNTPPEVVLDPPRIIKENEAATLVGRVVDPDLSDHHDVVVDWDDPNHATDSMFALGATGDMTVGDTFPSSTTSAILEITEIDSATGAFAFEIRRHHYLDDGPAPGNGTPEDTSTILVTVSDGSRMDQDRADLLVQNVAPQFVPGSVHISAPMNNKGSAGDLVTLSADFTDVGTLDQHTVLVDWGDGSTSSSDLNPGDFSSFVDSTGGGVGSFATSHTYSTSGVFTVTITLVDDDGGTNIATTATFLTGLSLNDGVLEIVGTDDPDWVTIAKLGSRTRVYTSLLPRGTFATFNTADIAKISAHLCGGDDRFIINSNVNLPAIVHGGTGNDLLKAGGGPSVLLGDEGNDRVVGGDARDILIGGIGSDLLIGGVGQDILIGGTTTFDHNDQALMDLMTEWNENDPYSVRVERLRNGTGATGLQLATGVTLFDDQEPDRLVGSFDLDWFFFDPLSDTTPDRTNDEAVN